LTRAWILFDATFLRASTYSRELILACIEILADFLTVFRNVTVVQNIWVGEGTAVQIRVDQKLRKDTLSSLKSQGFQRLPHWDTDAGVGDRPKLLERPFLADTVHPLDEGDGENIIEKILSSAQVAMARKQSFGSSEIVSPHPFQRVPRKIVSC
jgi:hypothetical protein